MREREREGGERESEGGREKGRERERERDLGLYPEVFPGEINLEWIESLFCVQ